MSKAGCYLTNEQIIHWLQIKQVQPQLSITQSAEASKLKRWVDFDDLPIKPVVNFQWPMSHSKYLGGISRQIAVKEKKHHENLFYKEGILLVIRNNKIY